MGIFEAPECERSPYPAKEKPLFAQVWDAAPKPRRCEICLAHIPSPLPWCFAHRLAKGTWPEYKLVPTNIALVCSQECHAKIDQRRRGMMRTWKIANDDWIKAHPDFPHSTSKIK